MLDAPTTRVVYVMVTPTISNWIQPIAIETSSRCGSDGDRDRVAIVDNVAVGLRSDHDPVASVDSPLGSQAKPMYLFSPKTLT